MDEPQTVREKNVLRIAVISDLHAYDYNEAGTTPPSYLCVRHPDEPSNHHPVQSLIKLIKDEEIRADLLVCCGDMGDKASPAGIKYVWEKLHQIKRALHARLLAATAGNHDVDSRFQYTDFDAKGFLQSLVPPFPFEDARLNDKYWARNYAIITNAEFRLLVINSSAYHGAKDGEFEHGRIAFRTVEAIRTDLAIAEGKNPRAINIMVCHHHPHKHGDIEDSDYSVMEGADKIMAVLDSGEFGNWVVIHGHKHQPRICYSAGGSSAPVVFSAGSFSAVPYPDTQGQVRNQFYLVEFPVSNLDSLGLGLAGSFAAWDWSKGKGWIKAMPNSGLPAAGGFGNRRDVKAIAKEIAPVVTSSADPWIEWKELVDRFPTIRYLLPSNLNSLLKTLEAQHMLKISRDADGLPMQIGK